jgi:hypothetical protein
VGLCLHEVDVLTSVAGGTVYATDNEEDAFSNRRRTTLVLRRRLLRSL